jgi:hypothetical protein
LCGAKDLSAPCPVDGQTVWIRRVIKQTDLQPS